MLLVTPLYDPIAYSIAGLGMIGILATFVALLAAVIRKSVWFVLMALASAILGVILGVGLIVLQYLWSTGVSGPAPGYLMLYVGIVVAIISSLSIALTAIGHLRLK